MQNYYPLRQKASLAPYKKGDVLVLFGELFNRGYANGLVEEAEKLGMTVIRATVGRREKDGTLRALNAEEIQSIPQPFINIPLEAGFDLEPDNNGKTPVDALKEAKLSNWEEIKIDFESIEQSKTKGIKRFRQNVSLYLEEVAKHIPQGANVLFAHLMAGGVPRAKIVMPVMNWVFKGTGDRYLASEKFWNSDMGKLCSQNFNEVTANTFHHLLDLSTELRSKIESSGSHVSYVAYGYHGTEVLINNEYKWQTYSPYIQGWAKIKLEEISKEYFNKGVKTCVYNCPEILTNSSSIFQGVEIPLYPLIATLAKETQNSGSKKYIERCMSLLNDNTTIEDILEVTNGYFNNPITQSYCQFEKWPQHSSKEQMEEMLGRSEKLISMHKDEKSLITSVLSEAVFSACGYTMVHDSWNPKSPVAWINHDLVAKTF